MTESSINIHAVIVNSVCLKCWEPGYSGYLLHPNVVLGRSYVFLCVVYMCVRMDRQRANVGMNMCVTI